MDLTRRTGSRPSGRSPWVARAVDRITGSSLRNLKELRSRSIRVLFVFDEARQAVLLVAGDKRGQWKLDHRLVRTGALPRAPRRRGLRHSAYPARR